MQIIMNQVCKSLSCDFLNKKNLEKNLIFKTTLLVGFELIFSFAG